MTVRIEKVKANKTKKDDGRYGLTTDDAAKPVLLPEDGEAAWFRVRAVNPIFYIHVGNKQPSAEFSEQTDSARGMEWHVGVTDARVVFWSPQIVTMMGAAKTVPGKATAGEFDYRDISTMCYGFSPFVASWAAWAAQGGFAEKSKTARGDGYMVLSVVGSDGLGPHQSVAMIEARNDVLCGIWGAIRARASKLSISGLVDLDAASFDRDYSGGRVVLDAKLSVAAPIDRWLESNFPVTLPGESVPPAQPEPDARQTCGQCGQVYDFSGTFCPGCGTPSAPTQVKQNVAFCMNCGIALAESARFCPNCGSPAGGAPARQQTAPVRARPRNTTKLVVERRKPSGVMSLAGNNWSCDAYVDGDRVDSLFRVGARVTIQRDHGFVCFLRADNEIYGESSELRIQVPEGQTKQVAIVYKKAVFGWTLQVVPW
jgi:RNA polymerase subunit RPABC4/transcription elongation factor Spt4